MNANSAEPVASPISDQHYRELPSSLYEDAEPGGSPAPTLIELNRQLLAQLGIDSTWFLSDQGLAAMSGNGGYRQPPIAMAYGGHQFGYWSPSLGDGRAHMLGQMLADNGIAIDVQLKGSGRTRFSRGGDGRATLGAVLREYMVSEAMAGLGIPTTRAIAVIGTGEDVLREELSPGAILVRSATSHIRVGTFQYTSQNLGEQGVQALADFVIARNFPELESNPHKYLELLKTAVERQASLVAQWMLVGFIHGVMNTDNMSIVGETIDYGPCAFLDEFNPQKVFSSIDQFGRYAWDQQPSIACWNLSQFAATLLPLIDADREKAEPLAQALLDDFAPSFRTAFHDGMRQKLGLSANDDIDAVTAFNTTTLNALSENGIDFTLFFDRLTRNAAGASDNLVLELFDSSQKGGAWLEQWHQLGSDAADQGHLMRQANPALIARNHRVEQAIDAAVKREDFEPFRRLCRALANPFTIDLDDEALQTPPRPEELVTQTFCGT